MKSQTYGMVTILTVFGNVGCTFTGPTFDQGYVALSAEEKTARMPWSSGPGFSNSETTRRPTRAPPRGDGAPEPS